MNSSLIRLANGETMIIKHDTDLPRPYRRTNLLQGTRGVVRGFPDFLVSLEDRDLKKATRHSYQWRSGSEYFEQFDHPLWAHILARAANTPVAADGFNLSDEIRSGDYLEVYRLIDALRHGRTPDFDVYDAASWSAVTGLSEKSVANRSQAVDFPDFTKGKWKTRPVLEIAGL